MRVLPYVVSSIVVANLLQRSTAVQVPGEGRPCEFRHAGGPSQARKTELQGTSQKVRALLTSYPGKLMRQTQRRGAQVLGFWPIAERMHGFDRPGIGKWARAPPPKVLSTCLARPLRVELAKMNGFFVWSSRMPLMMRIGSIACWPALYRFKRQWHNWSHGLATASPAANWRVPCCRPRFLSRSAFWSPTAARAGVSQRSPGRSSCWSARSEPNDSRLNSYTTFASY
jgi:hypothetical protein